MSRITPELIGPDNDGIFCIYLGDSENRICLDFIETMLKHLNLIERHDGPTALIIYGEGKFFSNGLLVQQLMDYPVDLLLSFHRLLSRILTLPVPTIAAINGHAFAGGAMIAMACDYRLMNSDSGFLCINEVDIGLPLTPGMCAIIKSKLDRSLWVETMLGAKRWKGKDAYTAAIVNQLCTKNEMMQQAKRFAIKHVDKGINKKVYGAIKEEIFGAEISKLESGIGRASAAVELLRKSSKL